MGKLEKIEKEVTAEVKSEFSKTQQNKGLFSVAESAATKEFRSKYFGMLESIIVDMHPPMWPLDFDSERNKEYIRLRNIILCVFTLIEFKVNYLIRVKLDRNFVAFPKPDDGVQEALNILLDERNYSNKVEALMELYKKEKIDKGFLLDLGRIRNAFAHALNPTDKKYIYKKRNVADDMYAFDDLVVKALEIKDELNSITIKQPEVQEANKRLDQILFTMRAINAANKNEKPSKC